MRLPHVLCDGLHGNIGCLVAQDFSLADQGSHSHPRGDCAPYRALFSVSCAHPLQFEFYLTRALEEAHKVGQKPVGADMIDSVLAKDIDGLEPRLTREGYNTKVLAELLNAKPREIKAFLRGQLAPGRTQELQTELLAAGIPL
jgi:hypothetical protein